MFNRINKINISYLFNKLHLLFCLCYNSYNMITYCYCGSQDTIYNRNKFNLIKLLFANVDDNIKDIWGNCFGIIGECRKYVSSYPVIGKSAMINIY